jgi:hypothetical protein
MAAPFVREEKLKGRKKILFTGTSVLTRPAGYWVTYTLTPIPLYDDAYAQGTLAQRTDLFQAV